MAHNKTRILASVAWNLYQNSIAVRLRPNPMEKSLAYTTTLPILPSWLLEVGAGAPGREGKGPRVFLFPQELSLK